MKKKIVIIGGGIVGASTAYALSKRGVQVTVIDRGDEGQATDAAAGIICPWLSQRRNKAWYRLVSLSAAAYPSLIADLTADGETDTGYKQVGAINLHQDMERLKKKEKIVLERKKAAPEIGEVRLLNESETKERFPEIADGFHALYISGAARVDGRKLRNALTKAAIKHGAEWIEAEAHLVTNETNKPEVLVDNRVIAADEVVVAAGAWMKELLTPLEVDIKVYPQKAQILHLENKAIDTTNLPVVMPPNNQYMLAFDDHRFVIGATHETKAGFNPNITAGGVQYILNEAIKYAPSLAEAVIKEARIGFRPMTEGSLPIIGTLLGFNQFHIITGLGASGLTAGPFLGQQMAKFLLNEPIDIDLADYEVEKVIKKS